MKSVATSGTWEGAWMQLVIVGFAGKNADLATAHSAVTANGKKTTRLPFQAKCQFYAVTATWHSVGYGHKPSDARNWTFHVAFNFLHAATKTASDQIDRCLQVIYTFKTMIPWSVMNSPPNRGRLGPFQCQTNHRPRGPHYIYIFSWSYSQQEQSGPCRTRTRGGRGRGGCGTTLTLAGQSAADSQMCLDWREGPSSRAECEDKGSLKPEGATWSPSTAVRWPQASEAY